MEYKFLLCCHKKDQSNILEEYIDMSLKNREVEYICHKAASSVEALEMYTNQKYDVVFIDISMPEATETEVSNRLFEIDPNVIIIYLMSYEEYTKKSLDKFARQCLPNPIDKSRLELVLSKAFEEIEKNILYKNKTGFFTIKKCSKEIKIMHQDVLYFEKEINYINIYMEHHKVGKIRMTLKELENIIDMRLYLRCHNGFIVNKSKVKAISAKEIELFHVDKKIPIGREHKESVSKSGFL